MLKSPAVQDLFSNYYLNIDKSTIQEERSQSELSGRIIRGIPRRAWWYEHFKMVWCKRVCSKSWVYDHLQNIDAGGLSNNTTQYKSEWKQGNLEGRSWAFSETLDNYQTSTILILTVMINILLADRSLLCLFGRKFGIEPLGYWVLSLFSMIFLYILHIVHRIISGWGSHTLGLIDSYYQTSSKSIDQKVFAAAMIIRGRTSQSQNSKPMNEDSFANGPVVSLNRR